MSDSVVRHCPHCGNTARQELACEHEFEDRDIYDSDGRRVEDIGLDCSYEVRICTTCRDLILYLETEISNLEVVYPRGHTLDRAVPENVRKTYYEAHKVQKVAPAGYAVLLRRALEALCQDRGVTSGPLAKRLNELVSRGEIPPVLAEATSLLRAMGNAGAHASKDEVTVPMTWKMDKLFRAVVEYVYIAPNRIAEFKKSVARSDDEESGSE